MPDISINKTVKRGRDFGEAECAGCGEVFTRATGGHRKCTECAKRDALNIRKRKFDYYFPVIADDWRWIAAYFLYDEEDTMARDTRRVNGADAEGELARREANVVTPCNDCPLARKCITKKLACRAFWEWSSSEKKKDGGWGKREKPSKKYYKRMFPNNPDAPRREAKVPATQAQA